MSILIKGAEMPKTCSSCACYRHIRNVTYEEYDLCRATMTTFNDGYASALRSNGFINPFEKRLDNCPCVEVPTPHGRLIDADAIFYQWYQLNFDRKITDGTLAYWNLLLKDAPTIIEEESE